MKKATINKTLDKLYARTDFAKRRQAVYSSKNYSQAGIKKLCRKLGNPQDHFKTVHIAGTKGKGSTASFLADILHQNHINTGLYLSPHIIDERDRFFINNKKISWTVFTKACRTIEKAAKDINLTVFDVFTAMAFWIFKQKNITIAVIETGLGGRLDSTNIIKPVLSIITPVNYDHTDKLGNTLKAIASEKAGIIKKNIPCISPDQARPVNAVIKKTCRRRNSKYIPLQSFRIPETLFLPPFQKQNLQLALTAASRLKLDTGYKLIKKLSLPFGRYTKKKNIIFDGAHNPFAMQNLVHSVKKDKTNRKFFRKNIIFYLYPDKKSIAFLKEIPAAWKKYYYLLGLDYIGNAAETAAYNKINKRFHTQLLTDFHDIKKIFNKKELFIFTGSFSLIGKLYKKVLRLL